MKTILLIEDEENVRDFLAKGLKEEDYDVLQAKDGLTGLNILKYQHVDLLLLDIMLPDISGIDICKEIRNAGYSELPVLMLTAMGTTQNVVDGLDSGADDYLVKPFQLEELCARIRSLFRRNAPNMNDEKVLHISNLALDLKTKTARRGNREIKLTHMEYRLLEFFMKNQKVVLSKNDLLENVWGINFNLETNVVEVYINYLRNKIDKDFAPRLIHTVIGMGYIIKEE